MKETIEKITDEYGQLHEDECELNDENGSFDGCTCAIKDMVEEINAVWKEKLKSLVPREKTEGELNVSHKHDSDVTEWEVYIYNTCREEMLKNINEL